jgi:creatinine amidohydrolase
MIDASSMHDGSIHARPWRRYEELRPDDLHSLVSAHPVAYWPLGLLEHHGWALPVGYDGLKADRICQRLASRTGGVIVPTMWWGGGGGHGDFRWTHYQQQEATGAILDTTVHQLFDSGFRAVVLLAGHYPWQSLLQQRVAPLQTQHPKGLILAGTELTIGGDLGLAGDHAALEETSYGLALFPEHIDMNALSPGREAETTWAQRGAPPEADHHPGVEYDPAQPLFGQLGADARDADAAHGEAGIERLVEALSDQILQFLDRP